MIRGWHAVYYRELLILKRRLWRMLASMSVSPLLYLIAFGYAMGGHIHVEGRAYTEFLIPGLVAMSSMTQAFGIASEINIARFYWHIFEEFQAAPISNMAYVTGEVLAGMTRALMAVCVILVLGAFFGVFLSYTPLFWAAVLLNSFVFASLAVALAMLVKSHADQAMINSFVIIPMAFLGGTFFPVERLPMWAQKLLAFLPLTHAARSIRASAFGHTPSPVGYGILLGLGVIFFFAAFRCVNKARD
ncbi:MULTISPECIES: ABC transporter permease [Desulfococcus]|jgi:Nod factor-specific ABC transporter NodJ protein|uniref:Transport permease protein n=1 Tax=Desulfococcus multivorans DSM 2059 TaxID=1121405 RepID=S7TM18_DESML|nr:ABC transporter permease [Desulfococcus multivorans]AQV00997.1 ABC transporter [Desulfococcus multivorans]EPR37735.1 ABC-2 type transporter [Desulfococcus multivorans DSM 2059]MDX9817922.1 ABC transporter permease [Desulfococcus multivorans]SJZ46900.1 ABC-2 type transporter, NodJ family [Desulfococcus multivorans DSM 2059]